MKRHIKAAEEALKEAQVIPNQLLTDLAALVKLGEMNDDSLRLIRAALGIGPEAYLHLYGPLTPIEAFKAAIDKAVQSLVNANVNLQQEVEELNAKLETINIKFINISPFEKFKNLFRGNT